MRYRRLGASELMVSEISLGSWLTYGVGVDADRGKACIHKALDLGVNLFDTANNYGGGAAEAFLGEALAGVDRASYILATKVFYPMPDGDHGLSAAQVHKQANASLRRLRTDYLDLYQCHRYDADVPLEETMTALTELVRQGKVRYLGFSEWTPEQIEASLALPGVERFVSSQPEYSILWRKIEPEVLAVCERNGISQIVWSPLAQGTLTGKYRPGSPPPAGSRAADAEAGRFMGRFRDPPVLEAVQRLRPIADDLGLTLPQLALAWVLRQPNVSAAIVGASRPEQIADNVGAAGVSLDDSTLAAIDKAVEGAVGP